jgi:hypothetical protein
MINKFLIICIFLLSSACELRSKLDKSAHLSYSSQYVDIKIDLKSKNKGLEWNGSKRYSYYGVLKAQLVLGKANEAILFLKPHNITVKYKDKKSLIYLDSIADIGDFWSLPNWDKNGFRQDKIYIVFDDPDIDWSKVIIVENR